MNSNCSLIEKNIRLESFAVCSLVQPVIILKRLLINSNAMNLLLLHYVHICRKKININKYFVSLHDRCLFDPQNLVYLYFNMFKIWLKDTKNTSTYHKISNLAPFNVLNICLCNSNFIWYFKKFLRVSKKDSEKTEKRSSVSMSKSINLATAGTIVIIIIDYKATDQSIVIVHNHEYLIPDIAAIEYLHRFIVIFISMS